MSSEESAELRKLLAEVRELRRANEILKTASARFATEHNRRIACGVRQRALGPVRS